MRLFVIWPEKNIELVNLLLELKRNSHEISYLVGHDDSEMDKLPGTIFHCYEDAMLGIPAKELAGESFVPPGKDPLNNLYKVESLFLTMLNRILPGKGVTERKRLYFKLLQYWSGVLKKYRPELVIFPTVPHFGYDYLIYELAQLLGIKTLMFLDTRIPGRTLFLDNIWKGSDILRQELERGENKNFQLEDLSGDLQKHYLKYANADSAVMPPHIRFQKNKYSPSYHLINKVKTIIGQRNFSAFYKSPAYLVKLATRNYLTGWRKIFSGLSDIFRDNLKKEYKSVQSGIDWGRKFVYVPLQVQPECSTSPQGGIFADQILMLKTLLAALPEGWAVYVKEHPIQWLRFGSKFSDYKYPGYYRTIAGLKNVYLVPMETNSYDLIDRSQAVATITGAAGWEAVLKSKPSIIFGYPWYQDCPVLLRVKDAESCREALAAVAAGLKTDQQKVINYLNCLNKASIRAFIAKSAGEGSGLTFEESFRNIADFLVRYLSQFNLSK